MYNEEYLDHEAGCSAPCLHLILLVGSVRFSILYKPMPCLGSRASRAVHHTAMWWWAPEAPPKTINKQRKERPAPAVLLILIEAYFTQDTTQPGSRF